MNLLEEINISEKKILQNESLVDINGGNPAGPCGDGYNTFCCIIFPPGDWPIEGIVCAPDGQSWQDAIQDVYPGAEAQCIPGPC